MAPGLALSLVTRLAPRFHPPGASPTDKHILTPDLIEELLRPVCPENVEAVARRSAAVRYRGRLLRRMVERQGLAAAGRRVRWTAGSRERLEALRDRGEGAFLTTWHAGPTLGLWAALAELGMPVLKFQVGERFALPPGWETIDPDRQGGFRAPAMKRALRHLRRGGCVVIPADMYQWSSRSVMAPCLGRQAAFSNAVAPLAGLSGASVLPAFAWWSEGGRTIEVEVQAPVEPGGEIDADSPEFERALIRDLARRAEVYLREHPEEYDAHYARMFIRHERLEADGPDTER